MSELRRLVLRSDERLRGEPGTSTSLALRITPPPLRSGGWRLIERNFLAYRRAWIFFVSGFFEPVFYLLSIGIGVGKLVGDFTLPGGTVVTYAQFVAPAMLATSAMNGAIFDATFNIYFKMKFLHLYDAVLATPMRPWDVAIGEVGWALLRGASYSLVFLIVMAGLGLVVSWWALLAFPVAILIGFAFAAAGMACTTWMRSWQDFEFIQLAILPMFLFSATFYPLSVYPEVIQWLVRVTPLYQGVNLLRGLILGSLSWSMLASLTYLVVLGGCGMYIASRRLGHLLLK
jgi:lipooligosaccharide transport system permease protein